jgi:hypothetical protein
MFFEAPLCAGLAQWSQEKAHDERAKRNFYFKRRIQDRTPERRAAPSNHRSGRQSSNQH